MAITRPIVLTGPPASGKTALAPRLAARLGLEHADVDAEVEREAGRTIAGIFAAEGEAGFRTRERRAFEALLSHDPPRVIAAGGGALLDRGLRHAVLRRAWVLSLDAPLDVLAARAVQLAGARPLLSGDVRARLATLFEARAGAYAEAHARVPAGTAPEATEQAALDALTDLARHPALVVPLGTRTYRVHVAPLATLGPRVRALGPSAAVLVTDARVARVTGGEGALGGLDPRARVVLPGRGERDKTLGSVRRIWDAALEAEIDRAAVVVGVGGGVVTDLAGFAAATLLRGVRYASAPTTLLAMADASVGGKTGFDHPRGKNLLGAFHQPSVVVCDPRALATLAPRRLREGLAEIAKVALVRDAALVARLARESARLARGDLEAIEAVLPAAIQAKVDVVAHDEREAGERMVLNFGHTLGHAIERAAGYTLPHGECVAMGMHGALEIGLRLGVTPPAVAEEARALLDALGLPRRAPPGIPRAAALAALRSDKKRVGTTLRFVLCDAVGSAVTTAVPGELAADALDALLETRPRRGRRVALR
jgi:shikimate kinase/3-dehydroquinate synthase